MLESTRPHLFLSAALLLVGMFGATHARAAEPALVPVPEGARAEGAFDDRAGEARVESRLYIDSKSVAPGQKVRLGVMMLPDHHWHTYWRNSGDSGLATRVTYQAKDLPEAKAGAMSWPAPKVFYLEKGDITTFGYELRVMHVGVVTLPEKLDATEVTFTATADYLTCQVECIPGNQTMQLTVPVEQAPEPADKDVLALFAEHDSQLPITAKKAGFGLEVKTSQDKFRPGDAVSAQVKLELCDKTKPGTCKRYELDTGGSGVTTRALIPDLAPMIGWKVERVQIADDGGAVTFLLKGSVAPGKKADATRVAGVIKLRALEDKKPLAVTFEHAIPTADKGADILATPLAMAAPPTDSSLASSTGDDLSNTQPPAQAPTEPIGFLYAILFAFLGGMILNVMPCVFPVLTLKIASITQVAHKDRNAMLTHGLAYAAGILVTMVAMALVVIGMRFVGATVGWGFQFQNPYFLLGLGGILILFAVNLFGAFEFDVPMGSKLGAMADIEPGLKQSFAEGLLCVLLATPCSAPFMGTAMGFALSAPALMILSIFVMLGVGLALPFVILCALPAWTRLLPKPGPWLEHLKHLLAFSLLATTVWLIWLIGQSFGSNGMAVSLVFLIAVSIGAWVFGLVQYGPSAFKKRLAQVFALAIVGATGAWAYQLFSDAPETSGEVAASHSNDGIDWKPFDEEHIRAELASGKPVFVDFTADWCITCKVNERTVLAKEPVLDAIDKNGVVMFKADWTRRDERIRAILAKHGKGGVPMYLVYSPTQPERPEVLPELLTEQLVIDSMQTARARTP